MEMSEAVVAIQMKNWMEYDTESVDLNELDLFGIRIGLWDWAIELNAYVEELILATLF